LWVPLNISSFKSSFIKDTLLEDVCQVDLFLRLGDVQVTFGILTHYYAQQPLYQLCCTPLSPTFIDSIISFDSSLFQMFGHLLGLRSFDSLEGPIFHKQASLLIILGGISFISTSTIAPTTYLKSWALVVSIIVARFMVNQCPFLVEALVQVNNNTFPFQQHLNATCNLLPSPALACLHLFEQFIGQQMVHLQDSILERLHHHTLYNMLSDKIFEAHRVQILSCSSLGMSVWFII
jgi:hypothetical protein